MKTLLRIVSGLLALLGIACLVLFVAKGGGSGKLTWEDPIVRKSIMTFAYKIYGDPSVQDGRYFLSKIAFHNDGTGPVHDLEVSYQIPDYISWTTPQTYPEIPAGQTVVERYYPQLPSKVTQLNSQTNTTLETKIRWADQAGNTKEQILRSNIIFHGVNEIEYTDLPTNEQLTWYDMFVLSPFATCMVTPNDPVVKEFVAEITKRTGGTTAGIAGGGNEVARIMKATYDYMTETGMRYTSDAGVPQKIGDVETTVQTVRMPRDVVLTNQGLCVELAILWASVMEQLGLSTAVVFVPHHALTVVRYGEAADAVIPIECTAITPMAVGAKEPVSFEKAYEMAMGELFPKDPSQRQPQIWVNVQEYQRQGFHSPELPAIEIDKIKSILAQRSEHTATAATASAQNNGGGNQKGGHAQAQDAVRPGYFRWVGANNMVSVDVPESWTRMENSSVPGMVFTAQDQMTSVGLNVFHYPNLSSPTEAMKTARAGLANIGARVKIVGQQQKGNGVVYRGTTSYSNGARGSEWVGMFAPSDAGVVGFFIGAAKGYFDRNQAIINDLINSARLGNPNGGNQQQQEKEENKGDDN